MQVDFGEYQGKKMTIYKYPDGEVTIEQGHEFVVIEIGRLKELIEELQKLI